MKMSKSKWCKLHRSYFCCGREPNKKRMSFNKPRNRPRYGEPDNSKWVEVRFGEWHIQDEHHPRGYRVRLSKGRMGQLIMDKVAEQGGRCSIGGEPLTDMRNVGPDHIEPSSSGGAWRDDHPDNIGAACNAHNFEKGSKRFPESAA